MKTILVTGGAGFVGSRLCRRLHAEGHLVISLDNYFTGSRDNHLEGVEYREGHTKDIALHIPEKIDILFHLGEYSRVEQSLLEPEIVWDLNAAGTFAVLEFWRSQRCKLVYAGSSTKFSDGGLGRNLSPYTWTKASNTELVKKPKDLIEYVLVHEMVNLLEPTHSEQFMKTLGKHYPTWREARAELNELPLTAEAWRE